MKKIILFILISSAYFTQIFAWPGTTGGSGPGFDNRVNDTPVDGGIVTVTALAIGYGVRQARKRKEEKNEE